MSETSGLVDLEFYLTGCKMVKRNGLLRATADARLILHRGDGMGKATSSTFKFVAPMGPIEVKELSWYLEEYLRWPWGHFRVMAQTIETQLPKWGADLFDQSLGHKSASSIYEKWQQEKHTADRRFTVTVDVGEINSEAAARLLGLPWELLHNDKKFLFQGGDGVRVRRGLPVEESQPSKPMEYPLRVLLVSPRPDLSYIDHRVIALPMVKALEGLGALVELTVLETPTFPAMRKALMTAKKLKKPFHVVHFDGHGIYHPGNQVGGLLFEDPKKPWIGSHGVLVDAETLAKEIFGHHIPLVFLNACQSAQAQVNPTASVAGALLATGVSSVVAMSHSVLVETARRFVAAFYEELVAGSRIGDAMLAGQSVLHDDPSLIHDWFVPVLYQESADPVLLPDVSAMPRKKRKLSLGKLPDPPEHGFVGRSRALLTLERLLLQKPYAVVKGEGGEGKTALAVELARWLVTIRRFERAVFVSLETHSHARTVMDFLGKQLIDEGFMESQPNAWTTLEAALEQQSTLVVLDNVESVLPPPPGMDLVGYEPETWPELVKLLKKFRDVEGTKLLFTSRENLTTPFANNHVALDRLDLDEAMQLVAEVVKIQEITLDANDSGASVDEIKALVEAVNCHARSLVLLAPEVAKGVKVTTANLADLMRKMDKKYPNERERSLYASVELSLRRLPLEWRDKIRVLGVFHGGADVYVAAYVMELVQEEIPDFVEALTGTGLAHKEAYGHLRFDPAMVPYLDGELSPEERERARGKWFEGMRDLVEFLYEQRFKDTQLASTLTLLELPNLLAALEGVLARLGPEESVEFVICLESLLADLGRSAALKRVVAVRTQAAQLLPVWGHARFQAERMAVERLLGEGNLPAALMKAKTLLEKSQAVGEASYPEASYDMAMAHFLLGRVLKVSGNPQAALGHLVESRQRFQALGEPGQSMASAALTEQGDCLRALGRLDAAAEVYVKSIQEAKALQDDRGVAVGQGQLGTVRMFQKRYHEALEAYKEARDRFDKLKEPLTVAGIWHQMGMVYRQAEQYEEAEKAYKTALAIRVQEKRRDRVADSLTELGNLFDAMSRLEDAAVFYRQAVDICIELQDLAKEGRVRGNLANTLIELQRFDEARMEVMRAIECKEPFGHAAEPWKIWDIFHNLERATNHPEAASKALEEAKKRFLAYRRDGGENHEGDGPQWCVLVLQAIQTNATKEIVAGLTEAEKDPDLPNYLKPLITALQAILAGSRDSALADDPALFYMDACELTLLLEQLS